MTVSGVPSIFEAVIVWRLNPATGEIENLVLDYEPRVGADEKGNPIYGEPQLKFPGGGLEEGEAPEEGLIRELYQETGLRISSNNRHNLEYLWSEVRLGHTKIFYRIWRKHCSGKLRRAVVYENDSRLSNHRWVPEKELYGKMYRTHHEAFKVSISRKPIHPHLAKTG